MNRIKLILIAFVLIASISVASAIDVSDDIKTDTTWNLTGSPYNVTGNVKVWNLSNDVTLTIKPGVVVNFSAGKLLWIGARGKLLAKGASDNKITFTGTEKTPGHWNGIIFGPLSNDASVIDNAIIEYGGHTCLCEDGWRSANIITGYAAPTITNSTIRNSAGDGILCIGRSEVGGSTSATTKYQCCDWKDPTITCNWITNNTKGVHTVAWAKPAINYNNICGNSEYGVLNTKFLNYRPWVDAKNNWWGNSSGPSGVGPGAGDAISDKVKYSDWTGSPVPCAPIPELSSIILVAAGIMMLVGCARIGRRD